MVALAGRIMLFLESGSLKNYLKRQYNTWPDLSSFVQNYALTKSGKKSPDTWITFFFIDFFKERSIFFSVQTLILVYKTYPYKMTGQHVLFSDTWNDELTKY